MQQTHTHLHAHTNTPTHIYTHTHTNIYQMYFFDISMYNLNVERFYINRSFVVRLCKW